MRGLFFPVLITVMFGLVAGYGATNLFGVVGEYIPDVDVKALIKDIDFKEIVSAEEIVEGNVEGVQLVKRERKDREIKIHNEGYRKIDDINLGSITADKFLIKDLDTGETIEVTEGDVIRKDLIRNNPQPIASITKLMTALVVFENMVLSDDVKVTFQAVSTYGKQGSLSSGEILSVDELLHALLLQSSNDAAEALAIHYGRSEFMSLMNETAVKLGMKNTSFRDPSGLSENNISSVDDLFKLVKYIDEEYPRIIEITSLKQYSSSGHVWYNNSKFRNDRTYIGGKNGYTDEARNTLVSIFELPLGEDDELRRVYISILGSEGAEKDMRKIVKYLLENIEYVEL